MVNRRDKVSYFYDAEVPFNYYGTEHPMKPARLRLAHHLVLNYGLHRLMNVYRPHVATLQEMAVYHSPEYLECVKRASASSSKVGQEELAKFGLGQGACVCACVRVRLCVCMARHEVPKLTDAVLSRQCRLGC
jgi:acetoin utilization deacetylase AcuC-like enzyme